jgi:hypothetical protein
MKIEPGQVWSYLVDVGTGPRARIEVTLTKVENGIAQGVDAKGGSRSISVSALKRRARGAYLTTEGPGPKKEYKFKALEDPKVRRPPRETRPHGIQPPSAKYAEALKMKREGKTLAEIGEHFGEKTGSISNWLTKARAAEEDVRNLKALKVS